MNYKRLSKIRLDGLRKRKVARKKIIQVNLNFNDLIAFIAIMISLLTMYFQFFYEKNELRVNFISADIMNNNSIVCKVVYHNKGNQDATILRTSVLLYQDSVENGIILKRGRAIETFEDEFNPSILEPGKQFYDEIIQPFNFDSLSSLNRLNPGDSINLSLCIGFINFYGTYSTNYVPMGWILLDSLNNIEYFKFDYLSKELDGEIYRSSNYRYKNEYPYH